MAHEIPVARYMGPAVVNEEVPCAVAYAENTKDRGRIYVITALFMGCMVIFAEALMLAPQMVVTLLIGVPVVALLAAETDFFEDHANLRAVIRLFTLAVWVSGERRRNPRVVHVHHNNGYRRWW